MGSLQSGSCFWLSDHANLWQLVLLISKSHLKNLLASKRLNWGIALLTSRLGIQHFELLRSGTNSCNIDRWCHSLIRILLRSINEGSPLLTIKHVTLNDTFWRTVIRWIRVYFLHIYFILFTSSICPTEIIMWRRRLIVFFSCYLCVTMNGDSLLIFCRVKLYLCFLKHRFLANRNTRVIIGSCAFRRVYYIVRSNS